jgi:hypothetical protein
MAVVSAIGFQARPIDTAGRLDLWAHGTDATSDHNAMPGFLRRMELREGALDKMET